MVLINLLPWREELRELHKRQFFGIVGSVAVLAIVVVLIGYLTASHMASTVEEGNVLIQNEIIQLDKQIAEIKALKKEKEEMQARMAVIEQLQATRLAMVHVFDELVKIVPDGIYLTKIILRDHDITLTGKAESNARISALMRNAEQSKWLSDPELSEIKKDDKAANYEHEFSLHLVIKGLQQNKEAKQDTSTTASANSTATTKGK